MLERIVQEDAKMRYHLLLEPDQTGTSSDIWWIRANQGHTMKVFYFTCSLCIEGTYYEPV